MPILLGGSHVSAYPELMLKQAEVDYVLLGEAEQSMVEFLKAFGDHSEYSKISGLGYKDRGELKINRSRKNYEINEIDIPDISDFDTEQYTFKGKPLSFVITSRSCPHKCSFCSVHVTFGTQYSRRDPDLVLEEIKKRYAEGIRVFDFEDDNLSFYKKEFHQLLDMLEVSFPKRDVQFLAMNGISYLSLDREMLIKMKKVGFTHLNLALVSSDKSVLESTKRPHTVEKYIEIVELGFSLGFEMVSYQIIGLPNESLKSMIQTLNFNAGMPVLLGASMYYRAPTFSTLENDQNRSEEDLFKSRLSSMAVVSEACSRDQIYTLFVTTRIINFIKSFELESECTLNDLLQREVSAETEKRGLLLLKKLIYEKELFAWTPTGLQKVIKFDVDLFFSIVAEMGALKTINGKRVSFAMACLKRVK